ncbi:fumarylacetoacetate hydrolase family protein [Rhodovulum sulfidophilum]|uniref:fumarylacetoacetate hydrolase family protein n=1 Tax=Rhodovulum sulfidophilum TaxID=35806 RepID=UPI0009512C59|nr:fumarylacetoacetate hydrolase family protein [Rhodovulum sulfidophilum]OLS50008.1 fumarylacetoacetate hydrolase [Rhodovulum sulfidophilum]
MTAYALPPPPVPSLAIAGDTARFPVRRIFCVGRNYAEHAREMGADGREPPFFFTKPADALVGDGVDCPYPPATAALHHEAELVIALGQGGADIPAASALSHVWGYAPGNDLTRRDLQAEAKAARRPWDMAKGFDASAVCGALVPALRIGHPTRGRILCHVESQLRQEGDLSDMIWSVPEIVSHLSRLVALAPGDLIYTGTPAGVGPVGRNQTCSVEIEGLGRVTTRFS